MKGKLSGLTFILHPPAFILSQEPDGQLVAFVGTLIRRGRVSCGRGERLARVLGGGRRFFAATPLGDGLDDDFVYLSVEPAYDGHRRPFPSARVCGYHSLARKFYPESLRPCGTPQQAQESRPAPR